MHRLIRAVTFVALLGAVALVVVLARQVRALQADLRETTRRHVFPRVGETVPPFDALTLDRDRIRVGEGPAGSRQLFIAFNTTCPICLETAPQWRRLDSLVAGIPGVAVVGWSQHADSLTRPYVAEQGFRFPVVTPDRRWMRPYMLQGVPNTMLVGEDGRVLYVRSGALTAAAVDSIVEAARGD